jgi:conjugative relaxase-like TrwC/TraI family protein
MMTIPKVLSAGQAQTYHKLEYTSAAQSYYKQGDEVKGEWQGRLATSLGLSGEVTAQEFSRLGRPAPADRGPNGSAPRGRGISDGQREDRQGGRASRWWDATFSAPKSVSLTALVGGDERFRENTGGVSSPCG